MRRASIALFTIFVSAAILGCGSREKALLQYEETGHVWVFVGLPGNPRAIIRIEDEVPHTILISEGQYMDNSLGQNATGDAEIILYNIELPDDQKTLIIPTGSTAVIDNSGVTTILNPGDMTWSGGRLEYKARGDRFDDFLGELEAVSKKNEIQQNKADMATPRKPSD